MPVPVSPQISASATAAAGPVDVGANFTPSFYSPFAVGRGANATATASDGEAPSLMIYAVLGLGVVVLISAVIIARKK